MRGRSIDDIVIERLCRNPDDTEMLDWLRNARTIPELKALIDLLVAAGLRLVEAKAYNLLSS